MDYKKVFWGVIFILIGLLFVLKNLNILDFSWYQFINLWPLLLILWGIAMLPVKGGIKLILSFIMVAAGVYLVNKYEGRTWFEWQSPKTYRYEKERDRKNSDIDKEKDTDTDWESQYLFFPYSTDINKATLKLDAAAGSFYLNETSDELVEVEREGNIGNYSLTAQESGDSHIIRLSMEETVIKGDRLRNRVDIKLHEQPVWDLDMNIGAARIEMDLSTFKTKDIKIDGGASTIRMKLGDQYPETNVKIDAGASSIVVEVPLNTGCQVRTNTVLSGKDMRDFQKKDSGRYETENFQDSDKKIIIKVDVAVSKIEVRRY